jgi:hypothetical protein
MVPVPSNSPSAALYDLDKREDRRAAAMLIFDTYRLATGRSEWSVALKFAADTSFVARLERNCPTRRKLERVLALFAAEWPDNVPWPAKVPRPAVAPE